MPTSQTARDRLAALASPDGGWGYQPGQPPPLEPTCLALLALAADREKFAALIDAGLRWVESNRHPDGTYRLSRGRPQAAWPTALVLFTKQALGQDADQLAPTADKLLAIESRVLKLDDEVADMKIDIDLSLRVNRRAEVVYYPDVDVIHFGRVSTRQHIGFASTNMAVGFARYLRKCGYSEPALGLYKLLVSALKPKSLNPAQY